MLEMQTSIKCLTKKRKELRTKNRGKKSETFSDVAIFALRSKVKMEMFRGTERETD